MANNLKIGVELNTNNATASVDKLSQGFEKLNQSTKEADKQTQNLEKRFSIFSKNFVDINAHLAQMSAGYKSLIIHTWNFSSSFIELNAQFEKTKKNIASLIAVNASNVSTTGKALSIQEKYQLALKESSKTLEKFNLLSQKSGYALSDLAEIFQSFYSGASKNMSFDESIQSFENLMQTLKISGLGVEQLKMTIDGLGNGAVLASSDLGRFLRQIGLTNEAIKEANQNGSLYELIMQKTSENVKVATLALGSYEDNVRLLKSNYDKLKRELSEPLFESLNENLSAFNTFLLENEKGISDFIKTIQSLTPVLVNVGLAYAALKTYGKIAPILTKGFLDLKQGIIQSTNALYQQRVQMLSSAQSISEINKKTLLLGEGFKHLAKTAKGAIPLILIERLFSLEDALDKAFEKTEKMNSAFKRQMEILDAEELKKYKKSLEEELENISKIGTLNNAFGNTLGEWTFEWVGDFYKFGAEKITGGLEKIGLESERSAKSLNSMSNAMLKIAYIDEKLQAKEQNEMKLQNVEKLNKELENALSLISSLKVPELENEKIEKTSKAIADLNQKLLELISLEGWENSATLKEQISLISNALANANAYEQAQQKLTNTRKQEEAQRAFNERLKEQNAALKELSQIGLSEYEKKLGQINEKLKEWQKLGINKKKIKQAEESLKIELDLEEANKNFEATKSLMLEFYESVENKQEAWALKELELREKYTTLLSEGLIKEEDFNQMVKKSKESYLNMNKDAKNAMDDTRKHYEKMIANMQKTIESSFFDVINGKIRNLKDLFKDLGRTILQDFLSPYISSLSGFLSRAGGGILGGLVPSFGGGFNLMPQKENALSSVVSFAKEQGLTLGSDGKYQGVVGGVEVVMDKTGTIEKGNSAFNDVVNVIDGASKLEGIMSGEWIDKAGQTYDKVMGWFQGANANAQNVSFSEALHAEGFSDFLSSSGELSTTIESQSTNIIDSVGNGFNSLFENLNSYINSIGTFGSNLLANSSAYLANWLGLGASFTNGASLAGMGLSGASSAFSLGFSGGAGYLGGLAANGLMGGLLGYGVGSLGDMLFGKDTHAGTLGAVGGALGSIIMPGIGTIVGGVLGSVIGGIFGKTKATGSGLYLDEAMRFGDAFTDENLLSYVDYKKSGWFSSKSWTTYSKLSDEKMEEINRVLTNQYATLVRLNANLDKFELVAGKYANQSLFDTALPTALLKSFLNIDDESKINTQIDAIKEAASNNNITYAQQLSNQFATFMQMQTSILSKVHQNDPAKMAKLALDDTMYALRTAMRNVTGGFEIFNLKEEDFKDLAQLSATQFNQAFNDSLRQDFSPENLEMWQSLAQAYEQANEQVKNLLSSIIAKTQELMQINQNFLSANGISNSVFEMNHLLNAYAALMQGLKNDLSENEKAMFEDIFSANDKLLALGYEGLNEFLSTGNTELRKELVAIITQFKNLSEQQNGLIFSSEHLSKLAEVEKLINAYENKDASKENDRVKYNENNKLLEKLNAELGILNQLGSFSANLINQSVLSNTPLNYEAILNRAKDDFKNGNLTSASLTSLQNAANAKANELKNSSSSFAKYQLEMLKMANEMKDLDGAADLNSIQDKIEALKEENAKLQERLETTLKDTSAMTLEELKEYKKTLIVQSEAEIAKMIEYLGEESPIAKYLQETITSIKNGATLTETTLKNLQFALLQYQNNASNTTQDFTQNITNPYQKAFANGGIVTRKTNAIIGENGYPEAVIPLKDGKGLKIDTNGVFEKMAQALEKAMRQSFESVSEKLDLIALKVENVNQSVKRANMDLSILTKQTREIAENI